MREVRHDDVTCSCGERISGSAIGAGLYDDAPLSSLSPLATGIIGSATGGLMTAGVTYIFASGTTSLVVGVCVFTLSLVVFAIDCVGRGARSK